MLSLDKPLSDDELDIGSFFVVKFINSDTSNCFCWVKDAPAFVSPNAFKSDSTAGNDKIGGSIEAGTFNGVWISLN